MRRQFVGGNWKMHGNRAENKQLIKGITEGLADFSSADVVIFPSFVYLQEVRELLSDSSIQFGAQNFSQYEKGAYTGEISGAMLSDLGCRYVLVGHSERRHLYKEMHEEVAEKFKAALQYELVPILCVGETQQERESGQTEEVLLHQMSAVIDLVGIDSLQKGVIAYEPVWAIGTGLTATPDQAEEAHAFLRKVMADKSAQTAEQVSIVYGGSVKANNADTLFAMPNVDGGLVGGASLDAEQFVTICRSVKTM